jgi:hypothetical protein
MRRAALILLAGAVPFGLATMATAPRAADPPLVRKEVVLDGMTLTLSLPEANASRISVRGDRITIDFARNMRLQRLLILKRGAPSAGGPLGPRHDLANGVRISYRLEDDTGGGSGGPIAELNGLLEVGAVELSVTCTDQSEWGGDPEWCLPIVARIELVKAP